MMRKKHCLTCGAILKGRIDKKYCDVQCRSQFHNQRQGQFEYIFRIMNKQLRKNRRILSYFCPSGKATIRREAAEELGFDPTTFTHVFSFSKGSYFFCYDYGFLPIKEKNIEKMLIVQKQDYMQTKFFDPWKRE